MAKKYQALKLELKKRIPLANKLVIKINDVSLHLPLGAYDYDKKKILAQHIVDIAQ